MPHYIFPQATPTDCGMYDFIRTVTVQAETEVTVRIFAMTRYILTLNGEYVGEGPCRTVPEKGYFDEYSVTLLPGENTFCANIMHIGHTAFGTFFRFTTVERSFCPKLLFEATDGKDFVLESDRDWKIFFYSEHKLIYNHPEIGFPAPWESVNTAAKPTELSVTVHPSEIFFDSEKNKGYGFYDSPYLSPRPIPPIKPGEKVFPTVAKSGERFAEYDFGQYMTAKVTARFKGKGMVKLIYAECYEFPDGKHLRDDSNGTLSGGYDIVHIDGEAEFQTFWFRAFRFIRVECDPETELCALSAAPCHYPLSRDGAFRCSDENYNRMYEISVHTLLCCLHEIFVDCPYYEQQQYVMDGAIEASVLMRLSNDLRPVRKLIDEIAASQRPNGLLCANYPATYHQIIPGFSFFWIFLLEDYYERTGDGDMVRKHLATVDKILSYFDEEIRRKTLIGHSPYWDYADWVDGWTRGVPPTERDDAITLYNLYYISGLRTAARLCEKAGRPTLAAEYTARAEEHETAVTFRCLDMKKRLFRDGEKADTFSAHTAVWGILADVLKGQNAQDACDRMFDGTLSPCSFSMNYYVFRALEKCGRYDLAYEKVLPVWQTMLDNHCTTWCESTSAPRSECHAWSCAPLYEFCTHVLGVRVENGILSVKPEPYTLTFANGTVPTRYGNVSVDWKKENELFTLTVVVPQNGKAVVTLPDGSRYEMNGTETFTCRL